MRIIENPAKEKWPRLIRRTGIDIEQIEKRIAPVMRAVKKEGDTAIQRYAKKFDDFAGDALQVPRQIIEQAGDQLAPDLKQAMQRAYDNIKQFHQAQINSMPVVETGPGVRCWQRTVPIEKVGLYIPGGSAPLFSSVLMLGVPAELAGCNEVILCTPPDAQGNIHPAILHAARLCGIRSIYRIGGAQAIAAMAYGSETVPAVYKIFGPGNAYVTAAKQWVSREGVAIDLPAGPSEVMVLADGSADPDFIAWDLLAQAEHGADSQVFLLTDNQKTAQAAERQVSKFLQNLPRKEQAKQALEHSYILIFDTWRTIMEFANFYAPEHLIINTREAHTLAQQVVNAGSVFIGAYTPESAGDYATGTNHTLPTSGYARSYSGVSLDSFVKKITFQEISARGMRHIGRTVEIMAQAESLAAHAQSVTVRLKEQQE